MRLVERNSFSSWQETAIVAGEQQPWGGGPAESLVWADKQRYVAALGEDGQPVGVVGALEAEVEAGGERFHVAGIGGLIVTPSLRGQGLGGRLLERILELAAELGPERAMLFCRPGLVRRYRRAGFALLGDPVFADQPGGRVEMPVESMWRPLREHVSWPAGRVDVLGLPF